MNQFMKNASVKAALKSVFTCPNGVCDNITPLCSVNSDCGTNGLIGNQSCSGNTVTVEVAIFEHKAGLDA